MGRKLTSRGTKRAAEWRWWNGARLARRSRSFGRIVALVVGPKCLQSCKKDDREYRDVLGPTSRRRSAWKDARAHNGE